MTTWPADDTVEADPADVAEQLTPAGDEDEVEDESAAGGQAVPEIVDVGEADPADVYEQAVPAGSAEDGWDRG